jgi:hypothetical protein
MDTPKPLGYWLQHLHNLLETHFTLALADLGSNRREWQLLNTLTGSIYRRELDSLGGYDSSIAGTTIAELTA